MYTITAISMVSMEDIFHGDLTLYINRVTLPIFLALVAMVSWLDRLDKPVKPRPARPRKPRVCQTCIDRSLLPERPETELQRRVDELSRKLRISNREVSRSEEARRLQSLSHERQIFQLHCQKDKRLEGLAKEHEVRMTEVRRQHEELLLEKEKEIGALECDLVRARQVAKTSQEREWTANLKRRSAEPARTVAIRHQHEVQRLKNFYEEKLDNVELQAALEGKKSTTQVGNLQGYLEKERSDRQKSDSAYRSMIQALQSEADIKLTELAQVARDALDAQDKAEALMKSAQVAQENAEKLLIKAQEDAEKKLRKAEEEAETKVRKAYEEAATKLALVQAEPEMELRKAQVDAETHLRAATDDAVANGELESDSEARPKLEAKATAESVTSESAQQAPSTAEDASGVAKTAERPSRRSARATSARSQIPGWRQKTATKTLLLRRAGIKVAFSSRPKSMPRTAAQGLKDPLTSETLVSGNECVMQTRGSHGDEDHFGRSLHEEGASSPLVLETMSSPITRLSPSSDGSSDGLYDHPSPSPLLNSWRTSFESTGVTAQVEEQCQDLAIAPSTPCDDDTSMTDSHEVEECGEMEYVLDGDSDDMRIDTDATIADPAPTDGAMSLVQEGSEGPDLTDMMLAESAVLAEPSGQTKAAKEAELQALWSEAVCSECLHAIPRHYRKCSQFDENADVSEDESWGDEEMYESSPPPAVAPLRNDSSNGEPRGTKRPLDMSGLPQGREEQMELPQSSEAQAKRVNTGTSFANVPVSAGADAAGDGLFDGEAAYRHQIQEWRPQGSGTPAPTSGPDMSQEAPQMLQRPDSGPCPLCQQPFGYCDPNCPFCEPCQICECRGGHYAWCQEGGY